jgi:hypothetical protein
MKVLFTHGIERKYLKDDYQTEMSITVSKMTTVGDFLKAFVHQWAQVDHSHVFDFDENHIRLWDFYNKSRYALLKDLSMPLHEANITEKQYMIFEFKEDDGGWEWPEPAKTSSYDPYSLTSYSSNSYSSYTDENVVTSRYEPLVRGLVGLTNLGESHFFFSHISYSVRKILFLTIPFVLYRQYLFHE